MVYVFKERPVGSRANSTLQIGHSNHPTLQFKLKQSLYTYCLHVLFLEQLQGFQTLLNRYDRHDQTVMIWLPISSSTNTKACELFFFVS